MKESAFYREEGRKLMEGTWKTVALALLIQMGISVVLSFIPVVGSIASLLIAAPFSVSMAAITVNIYKRNAIAVEDVFEGFSDFLGALAIYFLMILKVILWSLLLIIPGILKAMSYSMTFYIHIDRPELTASELLKESERLMQGHRWELFKLELSFLGWYVLTILTFGILSFWVTPYINNAVVTFYYDLKALDEAGSVAEAPQV